MVRASAGADQPVRDGGRSSTAKTRHRIGVVLPSAPLMGLDTARLIIRAIGRVDPALVDEAARRRPAEWNILFRGSFPDAEPLSAFASSCSERRLHAESEQVMRVLDVVALLVARLAADRPVELVIGGAARIDLPSLRGLLRIAERGRAGGVGVDVVLSGIRPGEVSDPRPPGEDPGAAKIRSIVWEAFWRRCAECGEPPVSTAGAAAGDAIPDTELPASFERDFSRQAWAGVTAEERLAGALLAMRAAFFSTSYDGGFTATGHALRELTGRHLDMARVREFLREAPRTDDPGSIGIGPDDVIDADAVRSLVHRYRGMTCALILDYRTALAEFDAAVAASEIPWVRARARLLRALLAIKRTGDVDAGMRDATEGLGELSGGGGGDPVIAVEAAWLHNVRALGHVQRRDLSAARSDERAAVRLAGRLFTTDATHLKVNLVSNLSVLAEYSADLEGALAIWRRFTAYSAAWSDAFAKHHAYREGGLHAKAGRVKEAELLLAKSHDHAVATGDLFYGAAIALEIGALLLDHGDRRAASRWYATATRHAAEFGDPYSQSVAEAGASICSGGLSTEQAARLAARATATIGYPDAARRFASALVSDDPAVVASLLPRVRTKLNRPFFPVRLEFSAVM